MLSELKKLHTDVSTFIDELERLTAEPTVRTDALARARLKLTRASRRRSDYLETVVYPALVRDRPRDEVMRVQRLRDSGKEQRLLSTGHIAQWTLDEIVRRWPAYCAASRAMRATMRDRIREEQAVLYPLLDD